MTVSKGEKRRESCYDSLIPVNLDGQPLFIDTTTTTLVEEGTLREVSCQAQYTAVVRSVNGTYLQADPEVPTVDLLQGPSCRDG